MAKYIERGGPEFRAFNKPQPLYDKELQMFREAATEPNLDKLRFLRWLATHDKLEHQAAGQSVGEFAIREKVELRPTKR